MKRKFCGKVARQSITNYAPSFEEVVVAYWFRVVRASVCPSVDPFVTLFDACHILWTVHARVLKFHIWILYENWLNCICFLVRLTSLPWVMLLWKKTRMNSCQQDISQSMWPRSLKLGQLIEDDARIIGITYEQIPSIFSDLWPFENLDILTLSVIFELGAWILVSW